LPLQFSKVEDAATALGFVNKFGPLTHAGFEEKEGDNVEDIVSLAKRARCLLELHARGRTDQLAEELRSPLHMGSISVQLGTDPLTKKPRLSFVPRDFENAIWLELAQNLSGASELRKCLRCNDLFRVGPGTGRTLKASFCSDRHRIEYHSLRRTKGDDDAR
jgi:hypothetical protein